MPCNALRLREHAYASESMAPTKVRLAKNLVSSWMDHWAGRLSLLLALSFLGKLLFVAHNLRAMGIHKSRWIPTGIVQKAVPGMDGTIHSPSPPRNIHSTALPFAASEVESNSQPFVA